MEDILWQGTWTCTFENQHNCYNSWDEDSKNLGQRSHTQDSDAKLFNYVSLSQENVVTTSALRSNFTHLFSLYKHTNVSILKFLGV